MRAKSGKPLGRYFPEVVALLAGLSAERFVADGELVIEVAGQVSFDALQMRLHPAQTRIEKLARETPARLVLFDLLIAPDGRRVMDTALTTRRAALEAFLHAEAMPRALGLSRYTRNLATAQRWLRELKHGTDGIVAKRLDEPYLPGERAMVKVKRLRTADWQCAGRLAAARPIRRSRAAASRRLHLHDQARGARRADGEARSLARAARIHRTRARRAEPMEQRAQR
jgi:ATP-dependent DNA ligase